MPGWESCCAGVGKPVLLAHPAPSLAQGAPVTRHELQPSFMGSREEGGLLHAEAPRGVGRALLDSEKMEGSLRVLFLRTWGRGWR